MAEATQIGWTRSSINGWIGCTEVSPMCDRCYARESYTAKMLGVKWGPGMPRHRTTPENWAKLLRWNRRAKAELESGIAPNTPAWRGPPGFWPVFAFSLADVFDNEVRFEWCHEFLALAEMCKHLTFYILTKRVGNVADRVPERWMAEGFPKHIRIIISVGDQKEADRDIPKLLALPCRNGVSHEPGLERVDWRNLRVAHNITLDAFTGCHTGHSGPMPKGDYNELLRALPALPGKYDRGIEWGITGGESKQGRVQARVYDLENGRDFLKQFGEAGVPRFFKQTGDRVRVHRGDAIQFSMKGSWSAESAGSDYGIARPFAKGGTDPMEWPEDLRVQEFP